MRTKTASVLFGLVTAVAGTAHADPRPQLARPQQALMQFVSLTNAIKLTVARPLADASGDVACGNVMDKGAPGHVCTVRTARPASPAAIVLPVAQPHVDDDGDVVCGNVMRKGGSQRICHARRDTVTAQDEVARILQGTP